VSSEPIPVGRLASVGCEAGLLRRPRSTPWRSILLVALYFAASAAAIGCASSPARITSGVDLGSPRQSDLRRADVLGFLPTASISALPIARSAAGTWIAEATQDSSFAPNLDVSEGEGTLRDVEPTAPERDTAWFETIVEEHRGDVVDAVDPLAGDSTFIEPIGDAKLRFVQVDGAFRFYNERGRQFGQGANFYASDRISLRIADHFFFTAEPEAYLIENRSNESLDDADGGVSFQELSASARAGAVEVLVGRKPLWWGPGRHGSLLLSSNATPLEMIRVSTADRVLLPGFLGYLGLLRGEVFISQLERSRPVKKPYLAGARLSTRLNPWVELGASRTAMFGGSGRSVTGQTILDVITTRGENTPTGPGDQRASIDARFILPFETQPFELYAEYGGEDEAGGFFSNVAYIGGVHLPRIGPWSFLELTVEVADTSVAGQRGTWYASDDFPDGYTFQGDIIGHHAGVDAFDAFISVAVRPNDEWRVELSYGYEEHLKLDPVSERLHELRLEVERRFDNGLWLSIFLGHDRWRNFRQQFGEDAQGSAVGVAVRFTY
jgi:hypothetical protein